MADRTIQKAKAGVEDLLFGDGTVTQTRNATNIDITKINADKIPYSGDATTADVVTVKAKIDESRVITDANAVSVAAYNVEWNQYIANDLEAAIALFGSTDATLVITDEQTLTGDLTIPSNITLDIKHSGNITGAFTLTINGSIISGGYEIFDSSLTVVFGSAKTTNMLVEWFDISDIGERINAAITSITSNLEMNIIISGDVWDGVSYATMIDINKRVNLVFPGMRNASGATYTGSTAAIKMSSSGSRISGGVKVDLTGNLNSNVDGIYFGATDCVITDGVQVVNAVRDCLRFATTTTTTCYHNQVFGPVRLNGAGENLIHFIQESGTVKPNGNALYGVVTQNIPSGGNGVYFENGFDNNIYSIYLQDGDDDTAWAVRADDANPNSIIGYYIDKSAENGVIADGGVVNIVMGENNVEAPGDQWNETNSGRITYSDASFFRAYNLQGNLITIPGGDGETDYPTNSNARVYASYDDSGAFPFNGTGNLVLQAKTGLALLLAAGNITGNVFTVRPYGTGGYAQCESLLALKKGSDFSDGDTTPSVKYGNVFETANTGATSITTFDDGKEGQEITVICRDANTTIVEGTFTRLNGSANFVMANFDTITLVYTGSVWVEKSRSVR